MFDILSSFCDLQVVENFRFIIKELFNWLTEWIWLRNSTYTDLFTEIAMGTQSNWADIFWSLPKKLVDFESIYKQKRIITTIISICGVIVLLFLLARRERIVVEDDTITAEQTDAAGEES
jgi:hypothetical protein